MKHVKHLVQCLLLLNESLEEAEKEGAGTRAHKQSTCLLFFSEIFPGTLQVLHMF